MARAAPRANADPSRAILDIDVSRRRRVWTWDRGSRLVDMDWPTERLAPILETVLCGALWDELKKFPLDTLERVLPRATVPRNVRRLVEIWIEEKRRTAA